MGRRILNRKELRADFDAAERRSEDEEPEDDEETDDEEEGDEGDDEEETDDEDEGDEGDEDDEDAPKKKKKAKAVKAPKAPKPKAKPRTRTAKVVRKRAVWGVFNNSSQMVASYEYPKKQDAEAHAAKLTADKRNTHFVQMVKEDIIEEKK